VTTNPTIFQNAITRGDRYAEQLHECHVRRLDTGEAVRLLTTYDVRWACDVIRDVFDRTEGQDGRVSIEVDPRLAHKTAETIAEAKSLWWMVDRPNCMIKIPAMPEGLPAITEVLGHGISVNVTLIFSLTRYRAVMDAYLTGLEQAAEAGHDLSEIHSVASFFVSRVDSAVDAGLPEDSPLRGTAAIANAKLAYERFRELFSGERWDRLAAAGARAQRPLWASTSTKNPAYPDTLYVDALVGRDTVNTMPMNTVDAVRDHGSARPNAIEEGLDDAKADLEALRSYEINLTDVTDTLLEEGIASFAKDFDTLLQTIATKLARVRAGRERQRTTLSTMLVPVSERLQRMDEDRVVERIWRKDHTVWKDDPTPKK
jgi:transaldolase